jgi:hypothetical protein
LAKITEITIGRLHNLGNYEHVRYEVKAYVAGTEDPGLLISRLEKLLGALAPIKNDYDYQRAMRIMSDPELANDETQGNIAVYRSRIEKHDKSVARRARALEIFNELGGTSQYVDAKVNWENDDFWNEEDGYNG